MMDSELKELRRRKIKRILLWTCGISAVAAIISIITIYGIIQFQSGGGG
ncbi:MAG: hypothetical protein ACFFDB_19280 [Promethearchaeota archaeon]